MMTAPAFKAKDVVMSYGHERVLKGVDLTIEQGEFVGIIGPNGAGKSTLLRILTGVLEPTAGKVQLLGRPVSAYDARDRARHMAVVPENPNVPFAFTVEELVLMGRTPYTSLLGGNDEHDAATARRAMVSTDTLHLASRPISNLSAGERQRTFLAQGLAQEPDVLVLDEPTVHLDLRQRMALFELLSCLNRDGGITVVTVLHDINIASQYCTRLALVDAGRIVAEGAPDEVLTRDILRDSFGVRVQVRADPATGRPVVTPIVHRQRPQLTGRVHVVCGGGCAEATLRDLVDAGLTVTCGVVNRGDADWEVARTLEIETVDEEPFSPVGDEALARNLRSMKSADVVVVEAVAFGHGNLRNLEAVEQADRSGVPVVLVETEAIDERDFTGGKAGDSYGRVRKQAKIVASRGALLDTVAGLLGEDTDGSE